MYIPENIGIAFSLTMLAGLTTAIGGAIAFVTKKDNLKALSLGLGFSAGVMIFISLVDIIPEANKMLQTNFGEMYKWLVFSGFILGLLISVIIDYFLPDHVDTDELLHPDAPEEDNHYKHYKLQRAGIMTAVAICVHNFTLLCAGLYNAPACTLVNLCLMLRSANSEFFRSDDFFSV